MNIISEVRKLKDENDDLLTFLSGWQLKYQEALSGIELFDRSVKRTWLNEEKIHFVKMLYHVRGHFHDFLWHLGSHAPNEKIKNIVLSNIAEEFSEDGLSHEQLYLNFAKSVGCDLNQEIILGENYFPAIKRFNQGHIKWLLEHDWKQNFAAFSAYEKLDNIDYPYLIDIAKIFDTQAKDLAFFKVHIHVKHFEATFDLLCDIWRENTNTVIESFDFIAEHQIAMWQNFSNDMFS